MAEGLTIPEIDATDAAWASRILGVTRQTTITIGEVAWTVAFGPPQELPGASVVRLLAGETSLWVALSDWNAFLRGSPVCEGVDLEELPCEIAVAVVEAACGSLLDGLSSATGRPWSVLEVAGGVAPHPWRAGFQLSDASGTVLAGAISVDSAALPFLGELIERVPTVVQPGAPLPPLVVPIEIGMTSLPIADLKSLRTRDVLLMDVTAFRPEGQALIRTSKRTAWRVKVDGERATLTEPKAVTPSPAMPLESPVVNVLFEYGDVVIPAEAAASLAAGQTLEVTNSNGIRLTIDGRPFGRGELVEVAAKLGVRILELGVPQR